MEIEMNRISNDTKVRIFLFFLSLLEVNKDY